MNKETLTQFQNHKKKNENFHLNIEVFFHQVTFSILINYKCFLQNHKHTFEL